jgi:hypothetical protein
MVYAGKGDYARAVADATRAAELKKTIAKPPAPQAKLANSKMKVRAMGTSGRTKAVAAPWPSKPLSAASTEKVPHWALTIGGQL